MVLTLHLFYLPFVVRALWDVFRWASGQYKGFKHLPQACEIMALVLIREGMVKDAESLLLEMENNGDVLDNEGIFCELIEKYVDDFDSNKAVMLFDWMRRKGLVPSSSCYQALLDHLVRVYSIESAYRICSDWVENTVELSTVNVEIVEEVIRLLCLEQRVQEARVLTRKLVALGCNMNDNSVYSEIALGYCEKQDFEDLLGFLGEVRYEPDVFVGNRILHSLCRRFGSERAHVYMEELEHFGFKPDEATFGTLIGWNCYEGHIKRAFLYLSEVMPKFGIKPNVYSYNAILSGLFRKGLWQHTRCILDEMKESDMPLGLSTYKIMVAGYCKARRFEQAKTIVNEMLGYGLIEASKVEDPLSEAFSLVGFDPLAVRLKRDNGFGISKAEFFDDLGNGLYLDTDLEAYEQRVNMVLDRSVLPEFNLLIAKACQDGDLQTALSLFDKKPIDRFLSVINHLGTIWSTSKVYKLISLCWFFAHMLLCHQGAISGRFSSFDHYIVHISLRLHALLSKVGLVSDNFLKTLTDREKREKKDPETRWLPCIYILCLSCCHNHNLTSILVCSLKTKP